MTWLEDHQESEELAAAAEMAARRGKARDAQVFYVCAALAEKRAFEQIDAAQSRTRGITAVSAVSLYYKSGEFGAAESMAQRMIRAPHLSRFALVQLHELLRGVRCELAAKEKRAARQLENRHE